MANMCRTDNFSLIYKGSKLSATEGIEKSQFAITHGRLMPPLVRTRANISTMLIPLETIESVANIFVGDSMGVSSFVLTYLCPIKGGKKSSETHAESRF